MREEDSKKLNIKSLSDLTKYVKAQQECPHRWTEWRILCPGGWLAPLQEAYAREVPDDKIVKMDPGLLYNALKDGQVQVALGFANDDASRASTFWSR